jgi:hypothetical protein
VLENTIKYYKKVSNEALKNLKQEKQFQFRKYMTNVSLMRANESYFLSIHNSKAAREMIDKYNKDMQNMYKLAVKDYNLVLKRIKATNDPVLKQKLIDDYCSDGIIGFVARNGAKWNIESYSNMYSNHINNQLYRLEVRENAKSNKFKVSKHNTKCDLCIPYEGRILTGEELDNSTLFHPHCKHFITEVR